MAYQIDQSTWSGRMAVHIAGRVRELRDERRMSAQRLSDACAELGHPIHRSVLANLENGRREVLDVCELFVIAQALGVAPMDLLVGAGDVEILDGATASRADAIAWIAGIPDADAFDDIAEGLADALKAVERAQRAVAIVTAPRGPEVCAQCDNDPPAGYTCQRCGTPGRP